MSDIEQHTLTVKHSGKINAYVQGMRGVNEEIIFTVHDLGCNHKEFHNFVTHPAMTELSRRCVWIHLTLPGQGENEEDLPANYNFPTMQELSEDVLEVFDQLKIKSAVLFGEGAGANILARFALNNDARVLGVVLIHCTGSSASLMESIRDKKIGEKLNKVGMCPAAESYLVLHRFGSLKGAETEDEVRTVVNEFKDELKSSINPRNLNRFIQSYLHRTNITDKIGQLKCPALFVTGALASHNNCVHNLYNALQKVLQKDPDLKRRTMVDLILFEDVANVLVERPDNLADSLLFFLQGLGLVISARSRGNSINEHSTGRRMSMEQMDLPRGPDSLSSFRKGCPPTSK